MNKFYVELSHRIRDHRINRKLTQEEVAKLLNVSRTCYANWEQATRKIDYDVLIKISDTLHIDLNKLTKEMRKYL